MSRPLIVTDCDEVLLHMVVPFRDWLDEVHAVEFDFSRPGFYEAMRRKACGSLVEQAEMWRLLNLFFREEMARQTPIAGSVDALVRLSKLADIVVLTNLMDEHREARVAQLHGHGLPYPVHTNQGGKGSPVAALLESYRPSVALFIDDLPEHHHSVEQHAPHVWRLHMVGEPLHAPRIEAAAHAHARIDHWAEAEHWIRARLQDGPASADIPTLSGLTAPRA